MIERLAKDLKREFPDVQSFSARNLKYMRAFAEAYQDESIVQEVLAQIIPIQKMFATEPHPPYGAPSHGVYTSYRITTSPSITPP